MTTSIKIPFTTTRTNARSLFAFVITSPFLFKNADAFVNPESGWKNRPFVPELEQQRSSSTVGSDRVPWDVLRFFKQSSKFVSLPEAFRKRGDIKQILPGDTIWEPSGTDNDFSWAPLDDVVMGGASKSSFDDNTGMWQGTVTAANNGGFVGIRTTPFGAPLDMEGCTGIELRLRGGCAKRFKAILRDSTDFNGVCWTSSFDVIDDAPSSLLENIGAATKKGVVCTVKLPFSNQVPTIFARSVPDQTFGINNVFGFQLAYSKFEYDGDINPNFSLGDFDLQFIELRAY